MMNVTLTKFASPAAIALALCLGTLQAQAEGAFAEGSNAKEFGLQEEEKATFSGKVVDVLCEVTGDCVDNCGNGNRNLGIVREGDGSLVMVLKNAQFSFNGPVPDLLPYCNRAVDVDGLLVGDAEVYGTKFYMVQFIREAGAGDWQKANQWTASWKARNAEAAKGKGPWFRRDPRVLKQIEATGYFGLGKEADDKYRAENQ